LSFAGGALAGGISALLVVLVANGFTKVKAFAEENGDTRLTALDKNGAPISIQIRNGAVVSPQFDQVRISTSTVAFPNSNQPNYLLKNESSVIKRIFALTFVPDATFQTDGVLSITLNEAPLFPITPMVAGDFTDVSALNIPIPDTYGLKILPKRELKVFIKSPNGVLVTGTIAVFIGELP